MIKVFKQVERILRNETRDIQNDFQDLLEKIELGLEIGMPHIRPLFEIHKGLFEMRLKDRNGHFRLVYFIAKNRTIYLVHAFRKKTQKLPEKEIKIIRERLKDINNE